MNMLSLSPALWFIHIRKVCVHTVGVSKQGRGGVGGKLDVLLDLGHIFMIGLTPSMLHAYIKCASGSVLYSKLVLFFTNSSVVNLFVCVCTIVFLQTQKLEVQFSLLVPISNLNPLHNIFFQSFPSLSVHSAKEASFPLQPNRKTLLWHFCENHFLIWHTMVAVWWGLAQKGLRGSGRNICLHKVREELRSWSKAIYTGCDRKQSKQQGPIWRGLEDVAYGRWLTQLMLPFVCSDTMSHYQRWSVIRQLGS